jgi:tetratricopeptide (TPR) repeat protein
MAEQGDQVRAPTANEAGEKKSETPRVGDHTLNPEAAKQLEKAEAEFTRRETENATRLDVSEGEGIFEANDILTKPSEEPSTGNEKSNEKSGKGGPNGAKRHEFDTSWWNKDIDKRVDAPFQGLTSVPASAREKINQEIRDDPREVDYRSAWKAPPQRDGGMGADIAAKAYHQRAQEIAKKNEKEKKPKEELTVCEVGTDTGKGLLDFFSTLKNEDEKQGTDVYDNTKGVAGFTSANKLEAAEKAGMFKDHPNVELRVIDQKNPKLPPNTALAMVDSLGQLPAHQLVKPPGTKTVTEMQRFSYLHTKKPLSFVDPKTGKVETVDHEALKDRQTAEGKRFTTLLPGLITRVKEKSKIRKPKQGVPLEEQESLHTLALSKELKRKEDDVYQLMKDKPEGWSFTFSPPVEKAVETLTKNVRPDGLVFIADHVRDHGVALTTPEEVEAYKADASLRQPTDTIERNEDGEIVRVTRHGEFSRNPDDWSGFVHPDNLMIPEGEHRPNAPTPLRTHMLEGGGLRRAIIRGDKDATISTSKPAPGDLGYFLVDRAPRTATKEVRRVFHANATPPTEIFTADQARSVLASNAEAGWDPGDAAKHANTQFNRAAEKNPLLERDFQLALDLAALFNEKGRPTEALQHAERAVRLLPTSSAAHIEIARALITQKNLTGATQALKIAQQMSPNNPSVYSTGSRLALQQGDLSEYIQNYTNYLRTTPDLETIYIVTQPNGEREVKGMITEMRKLCESMILDWQANGRNDAIHKTVMVENIATGHLELDFITVADIKRVRAAEAILAARKAAERILQQESLANPEVTNQLKDKIVAEFIEMWEVVRFRDPTQHVDPDDPTSPLLPLPRDHWPDRPPADPETGLEVRWVYTGDIQQSDRDSPAEVLYDKVEEQILAEEAEVESKGLERPERPLEQYQRLDEEIVVGKLIDDAGQETNTPVSTPVNLFRTNFSITATSGSGKTVLAKELLLRVPDIGAHFLVIEAGTKRREYEDLGARFALKEDGEKAEVIVIEPGLDDISVDVFAPPEAMAGETEADRVKETIDRICQIWDMAYSMDDPFPSILRLALFRLYADNGWDVGDPEQFPVAGMEPTVPTIEQLRTRLQKEVDDSDYGAESGHTIGGFFNTRGRDQQLTMKRVLEGGKPLDWEELANSNVDISLGHIKRTEDRLFVAAAIYTSFQHHIMRTRKGNQSRPLNVVYLEEATGLIRQPTGDRAARANGVEALSQAVRELRGYGVTTGIGKQSTADVADDFVSQYGVRWAGTLTHGPDQEVEAKAMTSPHDADRVAAQLQGLKSGEMLMWQRGRSKPLRIKTKFDKEHEDRVEALTPEVIARQPAPPIKKDAELRREIATAAAAPEEALKRTFVTAVTLGHLSSRLAMPEVPAELKKQWSEQVAENPERAIRLLRTIVGKTVNSRAEAISKKYDPQKLSWSALTIAKGLLDGEPGGPGRQPSAAFNLDPVVWMEGYEELTTPHGEPAPHPTAFAQPLSHGIPGVKDLSPDPHIEPTGKPDIVRPHRVEDQIEALRRNSLSPTVSETNRTLAWLALLGKDDGSVLWRDLNDLTLANPSLLDQRSEVGEKFGYQESPNDPRPDPWSRILKMASALYTKDLGARPDEDGDKEKKKDDKSKEG